MNVLTAVKQIENKYPVQRIADDFYEIPTGYFTRGGERISLYLIDMQGKLYLSDCADTANGIGEKLTENQLCELAAEHGFSLDDWHVVKEYESVADVDDFVKMISDAFCDDLYTLFATICTRFKTCRKLVPLLVRDKRKTRLHDAFQSKIA